MNPRKSASRKAWYIAGVLVLIAAVAAARILSRPWVRYLLAPPAGTLATEFSPSAPPLALHAAPDTGTDWQSYNKTLISNRFSSLDEINTSTVSHLKVLCIFDTGLHRGSATGILEVGGRLIFAGRFDTFEIDADDCHVIWRVHENFKSVPSMLTRGAAVLDGRVFRGTQDGRVIAYEFATGKRLWETTIGDASMGEAVSAAPIAWNGMVFIGNAGGDFKGVKGRMYALDAATGKILWEFYLVPRSAADPIRAPQGASPLDESTWQRPPGSPISGGATWSSYTLDPEKGLLYVPTGNPAPAFAISVREGENLYSGSVVVLDAKTGAYRDHYKIVPRDWHDWDVSNAPALIHTADGRDMMIEAPKDGYLYGFNLADHTLRYRQAVTRIENAQVPFVPDTPVHFCPGPMGGAEWNGAAYDPTTNLILVGETEYCATVKVLSQEKVLQKKAGEVWTAEDSKSVLDVGGQVDPFGQWRGWVYAVDADSGQWRWRAQSNYPVQSGMTPTKGGVVFFGDWGGNLYALDVKTGSKLWSTRIGGTVSGGVIVYDAGHGERVAAVTGLTLTDITTAKVLILGIERR
jgi:alcohol dehydrogenase (cytochrome c)